MATSLAASSCAACNKIAPRPTLVCVKCSEGVNAEGEPQPAHYCSVLCRDCHQDAHQRDCEKANRRKQVYRAGSMLQETLTRYRHNFYDLKIDRIEKRSGVIYMRDGTYDKDDPIFFAPPINGSSPQLSSHDINAVLVYSACTDVAQHFYNLGKKLLSDVALHIEEVGIRIDPSFCKVKHCFEDGNVVAEHGDHEVLAVDTVDGDTFIIDAAGSQFGQHRAALTLQAFVRSYCDPMIVTVRPFGHAHSRSRSRLQEYLKIPAGDARAAIIQAYVTQAFNEAIKLWEGKTTGISELLRGSSKAYAKMRTELLDLAFDAMALALHTCVREFGGCRIEMVLSKLERTQPMRDITQLTLSRKKEGSAIHQRLVEQRIVEFRALNPERFDNVDGPILDNGGTITVPCTGGEGHVDAPDILSMIQAMQGKGFHVGF